MTLIRSDVGDDPVEPGQGVYVGPSLEEKFMKRKPEQMSASEVRLVLAFLRRALQYDPKARPTTAQLLADPWIESIDDLWIERADLTHEKH
jgi:serine/threonine protein kinase